MNTAGMFPLAVAAVALAIGGCAATRTQKSVGETVDDAAVTAMVKSALIADPATEARNINVDTRRGVVQLNGFVESANGRTRAVKVANGVEGVTKVENNLRLQGEERSVGAVIDDGAITTAVKAGLLANPVTNGLAIKVETRGGRVELGGWVDSASERDEAGRITAAVSGVRSVTNSLDIKK
jgi:hyperosmotically inducible periplasmic protein